GDGCHHGSFARRVPRPWRRTRRSQAGGRLTARYGGPGPPRRAPWYHRPPWRTGPLSWGVPRWRAQRMWGSRREELTDGRGLRFAVGLGAEPATFADVVRGWRGDASFRSLFNAWLADAPLSAFRWETPPVTTATATRPFEFVLLDSPGLVRRPDPVAFAEHFDGAPEAGVVAFPNLGGDAIMI